MVGCLFLRSDYRVSILQGELDLRGLDGLRLKDGSLERARGIFSYTRIYSRFLFCFLLFIAFFILWISCDMLFIVFSGI